MAQQPQQQQTQALAVRPLEAPDMLTMAAQFAKSNYFSDAREAAQALVKIQYGQELNVGPAASMMGIHIISGKPSASANLIAGKIKGSGKYNYRVKQWDVTGCVLEFYEGGELAGISSFTMDDARTAELDTGTNKNNWKHYPRNMLFARAISNGARVYCPDVFLGGIYVPEELGAAVNADGEPLEPPPAPRQNGPRLLPRDKQPRIEVVEGEVVGEGDGDDGDIPFGPGPDKTVEQVQAERLEEVKDKARAELLRLGVSPKNVALWQRVLTLSAGKSNFEEFDADDFEALTAYCRRFASKQELLAEG